MPEQLTPVIREEEYLAAIAGQDVTPPDPATRREEWLDAIADNVASLASDLSTAEGEIDDLQDIAPTPAAGDSGKVLTAGADGTGSWQASVAPVPEAADSGKVLTAGADGTASWQTAGGGGSLQIIKASGECTFTPNSGTGTSDQWEVGIDTSVVDLAAMFANGPVYAAFPRFSNTSPYYDASETSVYMLIPWLDTYYMAMDNNQDTVIGVKKGGTLFNPTVSLWYEHYPQS